MAATTKLRAFINSQLSIVGGGGGWPVVFFTILPMCLVFRLQLSGVMASKGGVEIIIVGLVEGRTFVAVRVADAVLVDQRVRHHVRVAPVKVVPVLAAKLLHIPILTIDVVAISTRLE